MLKEMVGSQNLKSTESTLYTTTWQVESRVQRKKRKGKGTSPEEGMGKTLLSENSHVYRVRCKVLPNFHKTHFIQTSALMDIQTSARIVVGLE